MTSKWRRSVIITALALLMVFGLAGPTFAQEPPEMVRVIIGFKHQPTGAEWSLVRSAGGSINYDFDIINAYSATVPQWAISRLQANPNVAYVEIDGIVHAIGEVLPWGVDRIDADEVWDTNTGSGIKVAIIDTGIDYNHPDLAGNFNSSLLGYDFVNDDAYPMDDNGHGTHVAGIVAAVDNEIGVIGVAPEAELYAVKVLDSSGSGYVSDVVAGIDWAVDNEIQIISMSLGTNTDYETLRTACDNAYKAGLLVVAAAGNDGSARSTRDTVDYPARYDSVIAVAATNQNDGRAIWGWTSASSTGPAVELAAPGDKIYSTYWDDTYATMSGTSMACPHVTGTAALVWAVYPEWTNAQVRVRLQNTAEDLGAAGRDNEFGYGLVDAEAAAAPPPGNLPPVANAGPDQTVTDSDEDGVESVILNGSASTDDGTIVSYKWVEGGSLLGSGVIFTYSFTVGTHNVTLIVTDNEGATDTDDVIITVKEPVAVPTMHVADIKMNLVSRGWSTYATATVAIVDASGNPVSGATVSGQWSGATSDSDSGVTNGNGKVTLQSNTVRRPPRGTTFTFTVTDVTKDGWSYDPDANVVTSGSITK